MCWDILLVDNHPLVVKSLHEVREAYFKALVQFTGRPQSVPGFKFVYTPMHGVGLSAMKQAVERLGLLESLVVVEEQVSTSPNTTP